MHEVQIKVASMGNVGRMRRVERNIRCRLNGYRRAGIRHAASVFDACEHLLGNWWLPRLKISPLSHISVVIGVLLCQSLHGQENSLLSGSFSTTFNTAYIGKIGTVFDRGPTLAQYLDINIGSDWTVELWSSTNLSGESYNTTYGDEIDLFVTWHHRFDDIRVSLTGAYFFLVDLERLNNDVWIGEAEISYVKWGYFQPYLSTRYFGQIGSESPERGCFAWLGIRSTFPTGIRQTSLTLDLSAAESDGALGKTSGLVYARAVVGLPIKLGEHATLVPSILLQTPMGDQKRHPLPYTERNEAVGSLALTFTF